MNYRVFPASTISFSGPLGQPLGHLAWVRRQAIGEQSAGIPTNLLVVLL